MKHCHMTTMIAHFGPISLRIEAMAATHGVYRSEKTRSDAALAADIAVLTLCPNRMPSVETTLSFAITREISEVQILQSPRPSGRNRGSSKPASFARIL